VLLTFAVTEIAGGYRLECKSTTAGTEYWGTESVTKSGRTCQRWDSQSPHSHNFDSYDFPRQSIANAENYCRNPDNEDEGVWCYTTDPNKRWEFCDVDFCEYPQMPCKLTDPGTEYVGSVSVTKSGKTCQRWSSQSPHSHHMTADMFPDKSIDSAANYCRNPDNEDEGVWCYTTDPNKRWEFCDVPKCN
jgi:integrin beta 3